MAQKSLKINLPLGEIEFSSKKSRYPRRSTKVVRFLSYTQPESGYFIMNSTTAGLMLIRHLIVQLNILFLPHHASNIHWAVDDTIEALMMWDWLFIELQTPHGCSQRRRSVPSYFPTICKHFTHNKLVSHGPIFQLSPHTHATKLSQSFPLEAKE